MDICELAIEFIKAQGLEDDFEEYLEEYEAVDKHLSKNSVLDSLEALRSKVFNLPLPQGIKKTYSQYLERP